MQSEGNKMSFLLTRLAKRDMHASQNACLPRESSLSLLQSGAMECSRFEDWLSGVVWRVSKNSMPYLACWLWASSHRASCSHRIARCPVNHFTLLFFCFCEKFLLRKSSTFHQLLGRNPKPFCRLASFHLLYSFYPPFQAKLLALRCRRIYLRGDKVCYRSRS